MRRGTRVLWKALVYTCRGERCTNSVCAALSVPGYFSIVALYRPRAHFRLQRLARREIPRPVSRSWPYTFNLPSQCTAPHPSWDTELDRWALGIVVHRIQFRY